MRLYFFIPNLKLNLVTPQHLPNNRNTKTRKQVINE